MPDQETVQQDQSAASDNSAQQIDRPVQYPTATRIENGIAYDIAGKQLGPVSQAVQQKDDDFFLKLGGKPVSAQPEQKDDDFFLKLGGKPVQTTSGETPEQWTYRTAGGTTVGDTTKEILGHINEAASQGLGRNASEMWGNIKDTLKKHFGPNATDDVVTGVTNWIGNQIDEQYGPHGAVARYSPESDLGKRAIAAIPMMGPSLASIIENMEKGEYSQAALTSGKLGLQTAVVAGLPEAKATAVDAAKSAYMMNKLDAATAIYRDSQTAYSGRLREFENASQQASAAEEKALAIRKQDPTNQQAIVQADETASAARANASQAQKALTQAEEIRDQHGVKMRSIGRQIQTGATVDKKVQTKLAGAEEDFRKIAPPTASGSAAYTPKDYQIGRRYLEEHHQKIEQIGSKQELYDALNHTQKDMENKIRPYVEKYANEPITTDPIMDVRDALAESPRADFVEKGMNHILEMYPQLEEGDLTVAESEKIGSDLNALNREKLQKVWGDVDTALKADPEFAARYALAESLRNGRYDLFEEKGVNGIREIRQDEASIIRLRNAVQRGLQKGSTVVRGSGESGRFRQMIAWGIEKGSTALGAKLAGPKGAVGGGIVGERLGRVVVEAEAVSDRQSFLQKIWRRIVRF